MAHATILLDARQLLHRLTCRLCHRLIARGNIQKSDDAFSGFQICIIQTWTGRNNYNKLLRYLLVSLPQSQAGPDLEELSPLSPLGTSWQQVAI